MIDSVFKVGEHVRVAPRKYGVRDYPFGFIDLMAKMAGETVTIREVCVHGYNRNEYINGELLDGCSYKINSSGYSWSNNMFEKIEQESFWED